MTLVTVRNANALELNEMLLKMAPGEAVELFGIDSPVSEEEGDLRMPCDDEEFLHDLPLSGMPPYRLLLKRARSLCFCEISILSQGSAAVHVGGVIHLNREPFVEV
ncbi:unnamed protein product [Cylicostephanus goldi]|uniref:ATP-dependent DNA helicase n=1 Tax=Cylicostephanus goldi TaxID=71465 RepID=A0A3P7NDA7_CYLGO|nr:unnamed protein product [Cylicostephanus goldi]